MWGLDGHRRSGCANNLPNARSWMASYHHRSVGFTSCGVGSHSTHAVKTPQRSNQQQDRLLCQAPLVLQYGSISQKACDPPSLLFLPLRATLLPPIPRSYLLGPRLAKRFAGGCQRQAGQPPAQRQRSPCTAWLPLPPLVFLPLPTASAPSFST